MPFVLVEQMEERLLFSRALGIDVSSNNHPNGASINWSSVYGGGVTFAYVKATQGTGYTNPYFTSDMKGATDASIIAGAYDFANFNTTSAGSEANHFLSVAGPYVKEGYLRPALDMEGSTSMSASQVSSWVNTWANTVYNATGVLTVVYASESFAATYFNSTVTSHQFWDADYNGQNLYTGQPNGWAPFSTWTIWQVSSTGSVPGISGNVDLDAANGTTTGYVIPDIISSSGAKFSNGQTIHVNSSSGQLAWNTYASNGTSVTEPNGENGTVESGTPVFIRGYERVEVLYANQTADKWSADNLLAAGSSSAAVTASAMTAQPTSSTNTASSSPSLADTSLSNQLKRKDKLDMLVG
jgi:GH25 family lysozyme M1 (1,4-beta-N-acetylmuramidase)